MTTIALAELSAISPSRLAEALAGSLTFAQFSDTVARWRDELTLNFDAVVFEPAELDALGRLGPPLDVLAIVEEWCPDVITALPILARIERDTGAIRLHVLIRPGFQDIADAYPHPDGRSHIPTFVFFDQAGRQRGVFIERPEALNEWVFAVFRTFIARRAPDVDLDDLQSIPVEIKKAAADDLLIERRAVRSVERIQLVKAVKQAAGA
jgi:hypothetical protein